MSRSIVVLCGVVVLWSAVACNSRDSRLPTAPPRFLQLQLQPPVGQPLFGFWHRLAAGGSAASSEHEVMQFHVEGNTWAGRYDKHPEPGLGFRSPPDGTFGIFTGVDATNFVCQPRFPFYPCQNVVEVVEGTTQYHPPDGPPFDVHEQQIVLRDASGHEVLWKYWVNPGNFLCPWYRDFEEALANNPSFSQSCQ